MSLIALGTTAVASRIHADALCRHVCLQDNRAPYAQPTGLTRHEKGLSCLCINTWHSKGGEARPKGTTGLYHFAVTYPVFSTLQAECRRVRSAEITINDVVDHGPSLSVYLRDPDQNGIELSWDRPAETWWSADGALRMGRRRIPLEPLLEANDPWPL